MMNVLFICHMMQAHEVQAKSEITDHHQEDLPRIIALEERLPTKGLKCGCARKLKLAVNNYVVWK